MSTHAIEIVEISEIRCHPNADSLDVTSIWGWQCCVRRGDFGVGSRAIYIPPDYTVPTDRPQFAFLKSEHRDKERIRVRRLRGQLSQGLLIPVPKELDGLPTGSNVADALGVERYEPPIKSCPGGPDLFIGGPSGIYAPKFDVENYQRFASLFAHGEQVVITEKLHGANARYVFAPNKEGEPTFFCGSRTNWLKPEAPTPWWNAHKANPTIELWCRQNPLMVLFGEVFGQVQDLKYGSRNGQIFFAAFAALDQQRWLEWSELEDSCGRSGVNVVPVLHRGPFDEAKAYELAEGESSWPGALHQREGVVILPVPERIDLNVGRVCLKMVSNRYLER